MSTTVDIKLAIGSYEHTIGLKSGSPLGPHIHLDFQEFLTINRAFAPMVREACFDISEMALATFLLARAYDKPLVLLPVIMAARFQQTALLCRRASELQSPAALRGRRVGIRSYSQTSGVWLRGIIGDDYLVRADEIEWVTLEGAHVAEYDDPPWVTRATAGSDLMQMLKQNELDAVILGNDLAEDNETRPLIPELPSSIERYWRHHKFIPANHVLTARRELVEQYPEIVIALMRWFIKQSHKFYSNGHSNAAIGRAALTPSVTAMVKYCREQEILPSDFDQRDAWEGLPQTIG